MSVIIRLQNLPWNANALDIRQFFYGLSIPDGGVHIIGGDKGDAFIAFSTDEDARRAMMNDGGKINDLPIRLLLSSKTEMQNVILAARGAPLPPTGPVAKEPFGRSSLQEGFGSGAPGSLGGFGDFHGQRSRGGPPPPGIPAPVPPFGMGGEKRDGRPLGLGQPNPRFSGGLDYGGGEMRPAPDVGVRSALDRPGFGARGSYDIRPLADSNFPLSDPSGGNGGPLRGFGSSSDQMGGGQKGGLYQEPTSHPAASSSGGWGFPPAVRDGPGSGFGDRGFLEQDRNKDFARRDVMSRDLPNRIGDEFLNAEKGRLLGNQEGGRFGFGREFGRPEEGRDFSREEFGREFRKFHDQPGRPEPGVEFRRNDEFGQREPGAEFGREEFGGRRDVGRPEPGREFGRGMDLGHVEGGFPRDNRLRPFDDDRGIGTRDFARSDGAGDYLRPNAVRDFGIMPETTRGPMGGEVERDFSDRANFRPGFPRPDGSRDFSRPELDRGFAGPDLRSNLPRGDLGRGEAFSRPDYPEAGPLGFGRGEPEGARLGSRSIDPGFPRDIPPVGRKLREDGPGFGGSGMQGPNLEPRPFGPRDGEPRHPQRLGDGWRDQRERDLPGFPGRRMTPPRELMERFPGDGFGSVGQRDGRGYGEGPGIWVRVNNLPFSFNYREVRRFFIGCDIPSDGLKLINDRFGKRTGLAYVRLSNVRNAETALECSGRVVENTRVFVEKCSKAEFDNAVDGYKPQRGGYAEGRDRSRSPIRRRSPDREEKLCVVVKKLPSRITESDLKAFFDKAKIARNGGPFLEIGPDGHPTGCALIEFDSYQDFELAMFISRRQKLINGAEVKVIAIKKAEFKARLKDGSQGKQTALPSSGADKVSAVAEKNESKNPAAHDNKPEMTTAQNKEKLEKSESTEGKPCCVELQGVPWTTTANTVKEFFRGLGIVDDGIRIVLDKEGRAAGPVYVEFASPADCKKALEKNRQFIGKRYVNVLLIGKKQMMAEASRQQVARPGGAPDSKHAGPVAGGPAGRGTTAKPSETSGGKTEVTVSLKNLNFQTQLEDILEFFRGYHPIVDSIKLQYKDGKPTGDGLATFPSVQEAEGVVKLLNHKPLLGRPVLLSLWP